MEISEEGSHNENKASIKHELMDADTQAQVSLQVLEH